MVSVYTYSGRVFEWKYEECGLNPTQCPLKENIYDPVSSSTNTRQMSALVVGGRNQPQGHSLECLAIGFLSFK